MIYLEGIMSSPWIYLAVFAIAFIDGFFPVVPGETSVIAAGASAAALGYPNIALVIGAAAVGAFLGDHVSYAIGRFGFGRIAKRLKPGSKKRAAFDWSHNALMERGGIVLVVARYIPGGRTAITITCGAVKYPLRRFMFFDSIAALSWGVYSGMIGYFAGKVFEGRPLLALALGFAVAMSCAGIIELIRHILKKRSQRAAAAAAETTTAATPSTSEPDRNAPVA